MTRHRWVIATFLVLVLTTFLLDLSLDLPWFLYLIWGLGFGGIISYGSVVIGSQYHLRTLCSGPTDQRVVALTFDDGPLPETTPQILEILSRYEAKATFFCIGRRLEASPELGARIHEEGHLLANHTLNHGNDFDLLGKEKMIAELKQTNELIRKITGKTPRFFRPPYGVTNPPLAQAVGGFDFDVIGWNVRSLDTAIKNKDRIVQRIRKRLKPGAIILLHDSSPRVVGVLEEILDWLGKNDFKVVSLDRLLQVKAYQD